MTSPPPAVEATTFTYYLLPVLYLRDSGIFTPAWVGGWYINFPAFSECIRRMPVRKFAKHAQMLRNTKFLEFLLG